MSVQRWTWNQVGEAGPKAAIYILYADHARIVAEMEQAHAAALAEAQWMNGVTRDDSFAAGLAVAAAPRTLTADDPEPAVGSVVLFDGLPYIRQGNKWVAPRANSAYWYEFMRDERPTVLIHDGEATPQVNMGLRDRDEVENRLSSIRSLMLARPPRTTADALRALADDIQGAAIDGEATPSC